MMSQEGLRKAAAADHELALTVEDAVKVVNAAVDKATADFIRTKLRQTAWHLEDEA